MPRTTWTMEAAGRLTHRNGLMRARKKHRYRKCQRQSGDREQKRRDDAPQRPVRILANEKQHPVVLNDLQHGYRTRMLRRRSAKLPTAMMMKERRR